MDQTTTPAPQSKHWKKPFMTIAVGQAVSLVGSSAVQFSLIWWLSSETDSALMLSFAGLMAFLPQMLLGPFAGVWVDRLKRKTVIIAADLFIGLVAALFALWFSLGAPPYWSACVVLCIRGVGGVFHTPAIQSAVPMLVPKEELVKANGWSQFLQSGAFILGPAVGAALYAVLPLPVILLSDLIGAAVASITVAVVRIPEPPKHPGQTPHFFREMKEGLTAIQTDRGLMTVLVASTLCMVFFMPVSSLYPLMTSGHFQATPWHASAVEILYSVGMLAASMIVGQFCHFSNKLLAVNWGLLGMGVTCLICGLLPANMAAFWIFAVACCLMGASGTVYNIPLMAYMQETIAPEKLGRTFSLMSSLMSLATPIGLVLAGPVAEYRGVPFWFFISGIAVLIITFVNVLALKGRKSDNSL